MIPPPPTIPHRPLPPPPQVPLLPGSVAGGPSFLEVQTVLRACNWPTTVVVLDFETFFSAEYHMGKGKGGLSTIEYIMDDRFEELGLAVLEVPQPYAPRVSHFWPDVDGLLTYLRDRYGENLERCTVGVQNARFDMSILAFRHAFWPRFVCDVLNLASHLDARAKHDLSSLCKQHRLPDKGDTGQFKGLRKADLTPEKWTALAEYANNDAEREADLIALLLPRLTNPAFELAIQQHTLEMFTRPLLNFDFDEAAEIVSVMTVVAGEALSDWTHEEISGDKSFLALLQAAMPAGEQVPMKQGKRGPIPALAKDDEGLRLLKRHADPQVRALIAARQAVDSWPLHIARVRRMATQAEAASHQLPVPLKYYGAHTGRWSGGEGINLQNLGSRGHPLISRVRHTLVAPGGHSLVIVDAAQIEARVLAWIAGQADLVDAFARDVDIYSDFAWKDIFRAPTRKPLKNDPEPVKMLLTRRRAAGKVAILGLGYGMGKDRMLDYMESYPELAPMIEAGEIDLFFTKDVVEAYRRRFPAIPAFWGRIENAFRFVVRYGEQDQWLERGLRLWRDGSTAMLELPSSRCLFYPHAACGPITDGSRLRFQWGKLWGGTLTENIVQAISRDILAEAILCVEAAGYRVALHVHDEIIAVVPTEKAADCLNTALGALRHVPSWGQGLPLNAEGHICQRYEK